MFKHTAPFPFRQAALGERSKHIRIRVRFGYGRCLQPFPNDFGYLLHLSSAALGGCREGILPRMLGSTLPAGFLLTFALWHSSFHSLLRERRRRGFLRQTPPNIDLQVTYVRFQCLFGLPPRHPSLGQTGEDLFPQ